MTGIAAGRLRHRVKIQAKVVALDENDGSQTEEWIDAFARPLPAEITPLSGRELIAAQAVQSKVATRILLRYRSGVLPTMRVVHRGTLYNIEAVVPDPESGRTWLTLLCTSGVNEG